MATMTFTIEGGVNVELTLTELPDGSVSFTINVLDDTGSIGDLNAMFFDLYDDSLTNSLMIDGAEVTGEALKVNGVTKVDNFTNMNGEVINEFGKFDGGIQFGTSGIGKDDIRTTTFTISSTERALTLEDFALQDFGIRLTSVGAEDGSRGDSLKLGGTAPEAPPEVSTNIAHNDYMEVLEFENFDGFDFLFTGETSVLANDTTEGTPYTGLVVTANGAASGVSTTQDVILEGDNGGYLILNEDGSFDFSTTGLDGVNDFEYLEIFETAETVFTYGIEGGSTATLTVRVLGLSDGGPPPPPPPGGGGGEGDIVTPDLQGDIPVI